MHRIPKGGTWEPEQINKKKPDSLSRWAQWAVGLGFDADCSSSEDDIRDKLTQDILELRNDLAYARRDQEVPAASVADDFKKCYSIAQKFASLCPEDDVLFVGTVSERLQMAFDRACAIEQDYTSMRSALRVIHCWATVGPSNVRYSRLIAKLCEKMLGNKE